MEKFHFKKKYGQNFLKNKSIVKKIISVCDITKEDLVVEVGPGRAILTKQLACVAKDVLSYEVDPALFSYLDNVLLNFPNIHFIYEDFMSRDISDDISSYSYHNLYFISNVPYYITTPILMKLIDSSISFHKIVMMVQREVGERFSAKEGSKNYGSISVFLNYYYDIRKEFLVDRKEFVPIPNVDSMVISLTKKTENLILQNKELFHQLVRDSFRYKRKTIRNNLKNYDLVKIESVLEKYGFHLSSRAEQLPVAVFVEMSNIIAL